MLTPTKRTRLLLLATPLIVWALGTSGAAGAQALAKPTARVVLTVSGQVSKPNEGKDAVFDMKMLEALPQQSFTTVTPWYQQPTKFSGPLLRDVLAAAGATGKRVVAVALNDYKTELPMDDVTQHNPIVALRLNDKPMSVRDKGPLFVIYPFDSKPELRAELYYNRSIWQLRRLQVN